MTAAPAPAAPDKTAGSVAETPFKRFRADFFASRTATVGLVVFATIVALAVLAPWVAPTDPYDTSLVDIADNRLPPGSRNYEDTITYWLGTDGAGRDMLSAILYGLRTSLFVGAMSGVVALLIGMTLGLMAAYFGGAVDTLVMRLVDLKLGFPTILIAMILLAVLGKGVDKIIVALVVVQWAYYARTVRASALVERSREYMEAARGLALGHLTVVFKHLLPNCLPPLVVVGTVQIASAIALEATLSFLGLGLPHTEPSLGLLIANGFDYMLSGRYWISIFPGIALLITILSINLVSDHLRDVLNPRLAR